MASSIFSGVFLGHHRHLCSSSYLPHTRNFASSTYRGYLLRFKLANLGCKASVVSGLVAFASVMNMSKAGYSSEAITTSDPVVSVEWLHANLREPNTKVLDASWYMPDEKRNPLEEYQVAHIPGALFFDVDGISDRTTSLPHMVPSEDAFAAAVSALGIANKDSIVVYDGKGFFSAARVWWMFRVFGHDRVWVLDGGLPKWCASGFDVESSASGDAILKASAASEAIQKVYQRQAAGPITFKTKFQPHLVWTLDQVKKNIEDKTHQLVDARSKARFDGVVAQPRKGIRSGHIPGSKCIPFGQMLDVSQSLLPADDLRKRFELEGISLDKPVVASCGTGLICAGSILNYTIPTSPKPKTQINLPLKTLKTTRICNLKLESLKDVCKQGHLSAAVELFSSLFEDSIRVGFFHDEAYAAMTELCGNMKAQSVGEQIHGHFITSGAVSDSMFLNTKLVMMYGKCGAVDNAQKVFSKMSHRSTFTWNGMIGAWISSGYPLMALRLYKEMRVSGASLYAYTFPCVLKACGALGDSRTGEEIHGMAIRCGYMSVGFVVNALVSMYSKCNDLRGASRLFERMAVRDDAVLWNSMISAYSVNGYATEAVSAFREMQGEGISPNTYTFVATLQACEEQRFRSLGQQIHASVLRSGCHQDVYVANALLAFYARHGNMSQATHIFQNMDHRDHVSWNTMLSGFAQNGLYNDILSLFQDMLCNGLIPDQVSVLCVVMAAGRLGMLLNGKEVHAYAVKHGFNDNLQVGNTLLDMYAKCSSVVYMHRVYDTMHHKDLVSRTTVIAGYAQNNYYLQAIEMFREGQIRAGEIDQLMIGSILLACKGLKSVPHVKQIHSYIIRKGISDLMLQNSLVDVYGECGLVQYAARKFELIKSKDMVSWTSLITCYANNGLAQEALKLFFDMQDFALDPDFVVLVSLLSAVTSFSALKKGKEIHGFVLRKGIAVEGSLLNSLVDMYANCGSLESSRKLFDSFRENDLTLWTCMINAYGIHGRGYTAIDMFKRMETEKLSPDHITFLALLQACSHSGLVNEGKKYFEMMMSKYELEPWPEHYVCMVDLLGRANCLEEAFDYVPTMRIEPSAEVWCSLLNACRIHANEELGSVAAKKLLQLKPANPGNYVLASNLYASKQRWKEADEVRLRMKENDMKKNPGCSWIETNNMIHAFIARDNSHPQSDEIYQKLVEVTEKLEQEGGYVAETSFVTQNVAQEEKVDLLRAHSERLALAYGLITISEGMPIRITKNLRVCGDCHNFCKLVSKMYDRELIIRDAKRFHHFRHGVCSCGDFW